MIEALIYTFPATCLYASHDIPGNGRPDMLFLRSISGITWLYFASLGKGKRSVFAETMKRKFISFFPWTTVVPQYWLFFLWAMCSEQTGKISIILLPSTLRSREQSYDVHMGDNNAQGVKISWSLSAQKKYISRSKILSFHAKPSRSMAALWQQALANLYIHNYRPITSILLDWENKKYCCASRS